MQEEDNKFIIPKLFEQKFILFKKLENENNLNFDSFITNYTNDKIDTSYKDLFETDTFKYKLQNNENNNYDSVTNNNNLFTNDSNLFTNASINDLKNIAE